MSEKSSFTPDFDGLLEQNKAAQEELIAQNAAVEAVQLQLHQDKLTTAWVGNISTTGRSESGLAHQKRMVERVTGTDYFQHDARYGEANTAQTPEDEMQSIVEDRRVQFEGDASKSKSSQSAKEYGASAKELEDEYSLALINKDEAKAAELKALYRDLTVANLSEKRGLYAKTTGKYGDSEEVKKTIRDTLLGAMKRADTKLEKIEKAVGGLDSEQVSIHRTTANTRAAFIKDDKSRLRMRPAPSKLKATSKKKDDGVVPEQPTPPTIPKLKTPEEPKVDVTKQSEIVNDPKHASQSEAEPAKVVAPKKPAEAQIEKPEPIVDEPQPIKPAPASHEPEEKQPEPVVYTAPSPADVNPTVKIISQESVNAIHTDEEKADSPEHAFDKLSREEQNAVVNAAFEEIEQRFTKEQFAVTGKVDFDEGHFDEVVTRYGISPNAAHDIRTNMLFTIQSINTGAIDEAELKKIADVVKWPIDELRNAIQNEIDVYQAAKADAEKDAEEALAAQVVTPAPIVDPVVPASRIVSNSVLPDALGARPTDLTTDHADQLNEKLKAEEAEANRSDVKRQLDFLSNKHLVAIDPKEGIQKGEVVSLSSSLTEPVAEALVTEGKLKPVRTKAGETKKYKVVVNPSEIGKIDAATLSLQAVAEGTSVGTVPVDPSTTLNVNAGHQWTANNIVASTRAPRREKSDDANEDKANSRVRRIGKAITSAAFTTATALAPADITRITTTEATPRPERTRSNRSKERVAKIAKAGRVVSRVALRGLQGTVTALGASNSGYSPEALNRIAEVNTTSSVRQATTRPERRNGPSRVSRLVGSVKKTAVRTAEQMGGLSAANAASEAQIGTIIPKAVKEPKVSAIDKLSLLPPRELRRSELEKAQADVRIGLNRTVPTLTSRQLAYFGYDVEGAKKRLTELADDGFGTLAPLKSDDPLENLVLNVRKDNRLKSELSVLLIREGKEMFAPKAA